MTSSLTIDFSSNPSECNFNASSPTNVTCRCASNYFSTDYHDTLVGGEDGHCICPAGQYAKFGVRCQQCDPDTYSDVANLNLACTACRNLYISSVGSTSASDCHIDPEIITIMLSAIVVVLLTVIGGVVLYRSNLKNLALTKQLNKGLLTQVAEQDQILSSQGVEIAYLRDWR